MPDPETATSRPGPEYRTASEIRADQASRRVHDGVREEYGPRPGCHAGDCDDSADAVTPAGPLCREHADDLAADMEGSR